MNLKGSTGPLSRLLSNVIIQNHPRVRVLGGKLPKGDFMTEGMKGGIMERMNYGGIFGGISETVKMQVIEYALISPSIRVLI